MSNRDPDALYESLSQALEFCFVESAKRLIHTSMPGIVRSYDSATKRARVQPAIRLRFSDGNPTMDKPPILDVPMRQPATGAHMEHHQVDAGDVVLLCFSERGLTEFKRQWGELSDPPADALFAMRDAMAIPWGVETIAPVRSTGWLVQNEGGSCYLSVDGDTIRLFSGSMMVTVTPSSTTIDLSGTTFVLQDGQVDVTAGTINLTGNVMVDGDLVAMNGAFTHEGKDVGSAHQHTPVNAGMDRTGAPV